MHAETYATGGCVMPSRCKCPNEHNKFLREVHEKTGKLLWPELAESLRLALVRLDSLPECENKFKWAWRAQLSTMHYQAQREVREREDT